MFYFNALLFIKIDPITGVLKSNMPTNAQYNHVFVKTRKFKVSATLQDRPRADRCSDGYLFL